MAVPPYHYRTTKRLLIWLGCQAKARHCSSLSHMNSSEIALFSGYRYCCPDFLIIPVPSVDTLINSRTCEQPAAAILCDDPTQSDIGWIERQSAEIRKCLPADSHHCHSQVRAGPPRVRGMPEAQSSCLCQHIYQPDSGRGDCAPGCCRGYLLSLPIRSERGNWTSRLRRRHSAASNDHCAMPEPPRT